MYIYLYVYTILRVPCIYYVYTLDNNSPKFHVAKTESTAAEIPDPLNPLIAISGQAPKLWILDII